MQFLVNDVYTMWSSFKEDQSTSALAAVLKHVKDEVDVPVFTQTPTKSDDKDKKDKGDKKARPGATRTKTGVVATRTKALASHSRVTSVAMTTRLARST